MQFVTPKEDAEQRPAAGNPSLALTASSSSSSSSSSWLRSKDPRIVRVSRAFGGKDRHSKVRTIRGLRDRRVRLSVPTAIQLYDLQERLGLDQPSKVVDWLLNAAKDEIEELPPLPVSPENFSMFNYHRYHLNLLNPSANVHEKDDEEKEEDRSTTTTPTTRNYDFLAPIGSYYPSTGFQTADLVPFPSQILMCPATISTTTTTSATSIAQNPFASGPSNAEMREIPRQIMINRFQILNADSNSQINPSLYSLNQTNNVGGDGNSVRFPFEFSMGATARVLHSAGSSSGSRGNEFHSK